MLFSQPRGTECALPPTRDSNTLVRVVKCAHWNFNSAEADTWHAFTCHSRIGAVYTTIGVDRVVASLPGATSILLVLIVDNYARPSGLGYPVVLEQ